MLAGSNHQSLIHLSIILSNRRNTTTLMTSQDSKPSSNNSPIKDSRPSRAFTSCPRRSQPLGRIFSSRLPWTSPLSSSLPNSSGRQLHNSNNSKINSNSKITTQNSTQMSTSRREGSICSMISHRECKGSSDPCASCMLCIM